MLSRYISLQDSHAMLSNYVHKRMCLCYAMHVCAHSRVMYVRMTAHLHAHTYLRVYECADAFRV
jgi:hypothetical protein